MTNCKNTITGEIRVKMFDCTFKSPLTLKLYSKTYAGRITPHRTEVYFCGQKVLTLPSGDMFPQVDDLDIFAQLN